MKIGKAEKEKIVEIMRTEGAVLGYFFGSVVRGTNGPMSDIDVAVAFPFELDEEERRDKIENIRSPLERIYGRDKVDVVDLNRLNKPALMHEIVLEQGEQLFSDDPKIEKFLAKKALVEFEDTIYMRHVQSHVLKEILSKQL